MNSTDKTRNSILSSLRRRKKRVRGTANTHNRNDSKQLVSSGVASDKTRQGFTLSLNTHGLSGGPTTRVYHRRTTEKGYHHIADTTSPTADNRVTNSTNFTNGLPNNQRLECPAVSSTTLALGVGLSAVCVVLGVALMLVGWRLLVTVRRPRRRTDRITSSDVLLKRAPVAKDRDQVAGLSRAFSSTGRPCYGANDQTSQRRGRAHSFRRRLLDRVTGAVDSTSKQQTKRKGKVRSGGENRRGSISGDESVDQVTSTSSVSSGTRQSATNASLPGSKAAGCEVQVSSSLGLSSTIHSSPVGGTGIAGGVHQVPIVPNLNHRVDIDRQIRERTSPYGLACCYVHPTSVTHISLRRQSKVDFETKNGSMEADQALAAAGTTATMGGSENDVGLAPSAAPIRTARSLFGVVRAVIRVFGVVRAVIRVFGVVRAVIRVYAPAVSTGGNFGSHGTDTSMHCEKIASTAKCDDSLVETSLKDSRPETDLHKIEKPSSSLNTVRGMLGSVNLAMLPGLNTGQLTTNRPTVDKTTAPMDEPSSVVPVILLTPVVTDLGAAEVSDQLTKSFSENIPTKPDDVAVSDSLETLGLDSCATSSAPLANLIDAYDNLHVVVNDDVDLSFEQVHVGSSTIKSSEVVRSVPELSAPTKAVNVPAVSTPSTRDRLGELANSFGLSGLIKSVQGNIGTDGGLGVTAAVAPPSHESQFWVPPTVAAQKTRGNTGSQMPPQLPDMENNRSLAGRETQNGLINSWMRHIQAAAVSVISSSAAVAMPLDGERLNTIDSTNTMDSAPASTGSNAADDGAPTANYQRRRKSSMQEALDPTKINASLYDTAAAPCGGVNSPEAETKHRVSFRNNTASIEDEKIGSVNFSLSYDTDESLLTIRLIQARDLVPRDFSGTADPFCRLRLLSSCDQQQRDNASHLQSRIHRRTLCPEFEESFVFDVGQTELSRRILEIFVLDYDQFSREECVGRVLYPLNQVALALVTPSVRGSAQSAPLIVWRDLSMHERGHGEDTQGEVMFSLSYLPSSEKLSVSVVKAKGLRSSDGGKTSINPFVRVTIASPPLPSLSGSGFAAAVAAVGFNRSTLTAWKRRKKTGVKRQTSEPFWNETLVFNVGRAVLADVSVELTVLDDSRQPLGTNEPLGEVAVGLGSTTNGDKLVNWTDAAGGQKMVASRWYELRKPVSSCT